MGGALLYTLSTTHCTLTVMKLNLRTLSIPSAFKWRIAEARLLRRISGGVLFSSEL